MLDHRAVARFYRHREVGIATDQFPELLPSGIGVLEADLLGDPSLTVHYYDVVMLTRPIERGEVRLFIPVHACWGLSLAVVRFQTVKDLVRSASCFGEYPSMAPRG